MKLVTLKLPTTNDLDAPEALLAIIASLAHHLAAELDMNYEPGHGPKLKEELDAVEAASAALFFNGLIASDPVHHVLERFTR